MTLANLMETVSILGTFFSGMSGLQPRLTIMLCGSLNENGPYGLMYIECLGLNSWNCFGKY